ncbi:MAG TPA: sodium/glutamate symporter [Planctomycetaceae bacterium]|nr:sodium/glutamate symporter [Planctomycetaceae bacterium]
MNELNINVLDTLIVSIIVLYVGNLLTHKIPVLEKYSIPQAVSGGLLCSLIVFAIIRFGGPKIEFDLQLRDALLLAFFSTVGLSAKFSRLAEGGRDLIFLVILAAIFLTTQNCVGILLARVSGADPAYGLFAGSISFAGGHGTAIAWGQELKEQLPGADLLGIAFATFGLIAGGIAGGPLGERLIKKHRLDPDDAESDQPMMSDEEQAPEPLEPVTMDRTLKTIFILAVCISLGEIVNRLFTGYGVKLPGFLTSMMVGILITNLADARKSELRQGDFDKVGEVALQLFLAMSLMSMDLNSLAEGLNSIIFALVVQVLVISLFGALVVFRVMGRDYDAAVISAGFIGLGLGATPVAIANMNALTRRHGPSFKAFLVVPLVGAFFVDILNALIIKLFLAFPWMV